MKRKLLILLTLVGFSVFLLTEDTNQKVGANTFDTCTSQCEEQKNNCDINTQGNYNNCIQAAASGSNYVRKGVTYLSVNYGDCSTFASEDAQVCSNQFLICHMNCDSGGSPGPPSGGGGPERTPAQRACYEALRLCLDGESRSEEVQYCIDSGAGTVGECCGAEYKLCMSSAQ